ncbi:alpha/beta fold hydrolase [Marichromatium bheemlicum]|uniref:Alpha/beta hydrolase n=1 Tax=Marichromatium bheemlicum TaxID=365339 RepID=A0ABX1I4P6_9GAMM|nr:alpha/beta hydrolase [Marichromatium bheemlicum]NKN32533.1 alpha/beta hydrolase [Marichromatium bheemlicum]
MNTPTPRDRQLTLSDGRQLGYTEYGTAHGRPVCYCHGFPSSRREAGLLHQAARRQGIRLIAPDRPGYGLSSDQPGREIRDWPADLAALADRLALDRFDLIGVSGGGPYALACVEALPTRVGHCLLVCPLGPIYLDPVRRAMAPGVRLSLSLARRIPWLTERIYTGPVPALLAARPELVARLRYRNAAAPDRAVLDRPEVTAALDRTIVDAMCNGAPGARRDLHLYPRPWGFDPTGIDRTITLWHGDTDNTVPLAHAHWYAHHLPACRARILRGEGHYSLPVRHALTLLQALAEHD